MHRLDQKVFIFLCFCRLVVNTWINSKMGSKRRILHAYVETNYTVGVDSRSLTLSWGNISAMYSSFSSSLSMPGTFKVFS